MNIIDMHSVRPMSDSDLSDFAANGLFVHIEMLFAIVFHITAETDIVVRNRYGYGNGREEQSDGESGGLIVARARD